MANEVLRAPEATAGKNGPFFTHLMSSTTRQLLTVSSQQHTNANTRSIEFSCASRHQVHAIQA
jgi:hypothetical protein